MTLLDSLDVDSELSKVFYAQLKKQHGHITALDIKKNGTFSEENQIIGQYNPCEEILKGIQAYELNQKLKKNLQQMGLKLFFFKLGTSKYYCLFFISTTNFTRATPGFIQITFYLIFFTIYYFYVIKIEIKIELESSKFYNFFYYLKYVWDYPKYIFLQMRNE